MDSDLDYRLRENLHILPSPRKVALPLVLWELFGGKDRFVMWGTAAIFTMLLLTFGFTKSFATLAAVTLLGDTESVQGVVFDAEDVALGEDTYGVALSFEYDVAGVRYNTRSVLSETHPEYEHYLGLVDRGPMNMPVEYLSAAPQIARLDGAGWTEISSVKMIFVLATILVLLGIISHYTWRGVRRVIIMMNGIVGPAVLRGIEELSTSDSSEESPTFKYTYVLTASDGSLHEIAHVGPRSDARKVANDPHEPVLYLEDDPSQHILFDSLSDMVTQSRRGDFECSNPVLAVAAASLPLMIVGLLLLDAWSIL